MGQFCSFHNTAARNLQHGYVVWSEATGGITKETYYSDLESRQETGDAVREVIMYLRHRQMTV